MTTAPTVPTTSGKPVKPPREEDPRNPNHRLAALFDEEPKTGARGGGILLAPPPTVVPKRTTLAAVAAHIGG